LHARDTNKCADRDGHAFNKTNNENKKHTTKERKRDTQNNRTIEETKENEKERIRE
jgi:hypothetical protein